MRHPNMHQVSTLLMPIHRHVTDGHTTGCPNWRRCQGNGPDGQPTFRPTCRRTVGDSGGPTDSSADRPPCCTGNKGPLLSQLLPDTLHLRSQSHNINVLIDTGCLQANIISAKIASLLAKDGGPTNIVLTEGIDGQSYGVQGIMNVTVNFKTNNKMSRCDIFAYAQLYVGM